MLDIYVINLKYRKDKKKKIEAIYKKYKNINLIFIEAIKNNNGAIGCFMSHQKCIQIAKEKNLDYVIVMEDDTFPRPNIDFYKELDETLNYLKTKNDWNIFLGVANKVGPDNIKQITKHNGNNYILTDKSFITNLVIYNKNSYDFFLAADPKQCPIDVYWHYKVLAAVRVPFLVKTYKTYSDIENRDVDYNDLFDATEKNILTFINTRMQ